MLVRASALDGHQGSTDEVPHRTTGHPYRVLSVSVRLHGARRGADMSAGWAVRCHAAPCACASLCRRVRRRGAASSDHTAHSAASPLTPLPDTNCDGTASVPRVSLGCDASGLSTCVWREGRGLWRGRGHKIKLVYYRVCQYRCFDNQCVWPRSSKRDIRHHGDKS